MNKLPWPNFIQKENTYLGSIPVNTIHEFRTLFEKVKREAGKAPELVVARPNFLSEDSTRAHVKKIKEAIEEARQNGGSVLLKPVSLNRSMSAMICIFFAEKINDDNACEDFLEILKNPQMNFQELTYIVDGNPPERKQKPKRKHRRK